MWSVIYFGLFAIIAWYFRKLKGDQPLEVFVFISSIFTTGILPDLLSRIIEPVPTAPQALCESDHEIVIYLVMTLLSCMLVALWGLGLGYKGMGTGKVPRIARLMTLLYIVVGSVTIILALGWQTWFVGYDAFQNKLILSFIWPSVVAAPISYARLILAAVIFTIPFIRDSINSSSAASGPLSN